MICTMHIHVATEVFINDGELVTRCIECSRLVSFEATLDKQKDKELDEWLETQGHSNTLLEV